MQASEENHTPFSAFSLWLCYYYSINKLNPRLIWIAPPYNLLFIHCFSLSYVLLNLKIPFFSAQQLLQTEHQRHAIHLSQWFPLKKKHKLTTWHMVMNLVLPIFLFPNIHFLSFLRYRSIYNTVTTFSLLDFELDWHLSIKMTSSTTFLEWYATNMLLWVYLWQIHKVSCQKFANKLDQKTRTVHVWGNYTKVSNPWKFYTEKWLFFCPHSS